jgi:adenylosuccinate lyase
MDLADRDEDRGHAHAGLENVATPECRDISQSSVERHILPDATSQLHYIAKKATGLVTGLVVFPERMLETLDRTHGVWAGQRLCYALVAQGRAHSDAYEFVQRCSFKAKSEQRTSSRS